VVGHINAWANFSVMLAGETVAQMAAEFIGSDLNPFFPVWLFQQKFRIILSDQVRKKNEN
jgi:hypothetical protein